MFRHRRWRRRRRRSAFSSHLSSLSWCVSFIFHSSGSCRAPAASYVDVRTSGGRRFIFRDSFSSSTFGITLAYLFTNSILYHVVVGIDYYYFWLDLARISFLSLSFIFFSFRSIKLLKTSVILSLSINDIFEEKFSGSLGFLTIDACSVVWTGRVSLRFPSNFFWYVCIWFCFY